MLVVALTGGIGSGKSVVSDQFAKLGVPVIDADLIAREIVQPGSPTLAEIAARFGQETIDSDGRLRRDYLRDIAFSNAQSRRELESIMHPRIRAIMQERLENLDAPYALVVIPLLLESGQTAIADRILVVDVPRSTQVERVSLRDGLDISQIETILAAQSNRAERLAAADDIVDNSAGLDSLFSRIAALHQKYLSLASADTQSQSDISTQRE